MIFAHAGNTEQATGILNTTESFARKKIDAGGLGVALRHIAKAFAETEQLAQALNILSDVSDNSNPTPVLIAAATKQALAGDAAAALAAANTIEAVRFRTVVLGQIALTKAENGYKDAADVTLKLALAAIEKIKFSYARSYAVLCGVQSEPMSLLGVLTLTSKKQVICGMISGLMGSLVPPRLFRKWPALCQPRLNQDLYQDFYLRKVLVRVLCASWVYCAKSYASLMREFFR